MKNVLRSTVLLVAFSMLVGCGWSQIPPAHKGKLLSGAGYQNEVLVPGRKFKWAWQDLILLDMSTHTFSETMTVILRDRLEFKFDVKFRGRLRSDPDIINAMFNDIKVPQDGLLDLRTIYAIYGQMIIQNKSKVVLNRYTSDEVFANYAVISDELAAAVAPELENTPITLENVIINNMRFPDVVTEAVTIAKGRELDIERERAQNEIDLLKRENENALAEAEYITRMTRAKTIRDENRTIAEGVTPELLEFYRIEVQKEFAKQAASGANMTFMPIESLSTVGGSMRVYGKQ